jgi:hypothetical protein
MAKLLSGALISYGPILPDATASIDGALFYKTDGLIGPSKGLYVYGFTADSNSAAFGQQVSQGWTKATADQVDADTLDGFDSTHFQTQDASLDALAAISAASTGMYVITGASTSAVRTLTAGSTKISITNGSGVAGNPTIDVTEANLTLSNLGGTLTVAKGGTNLTTSTQGGIAYGASTTAHGFTAAGTATSGSGTSQNWQVLISGGTGAPSWLNATSLNVSRAVSAGTATTASGVAWSGVTGTPTTLLGYGITDTVSTTAYVDAADYLNLPPLAGTLKDNTVPVYASFGFSQGVWNDTTYAWVGASGRQVFFYGTSTPTGDARYYRAYRFSDNDTLVYDNDPVSAVFLLPTEKVNYIANMGTFFALLYITSITYPNTLTRVVLVKTAGSSDWRDWVFAYDVTTLYAVRTNLSLIETASGDRILRGIMNSAQDLYTLEVYDSSLTLLRSQVLYTKSTDLQLLDVTEAPVTTMVPGTKYLISSIGTTNFTLYGAVSNTVGQSFTATAPGTGTGTVTQRRINTPTTLLNYSGHGNIYPFTWNPFLETFYTVFSTYYDFATPFDASTGQSWGLHVSWDVPRSWIETGVGTPQNKIPVKGDGYRYHAQPDATWNTDDGGVVSTWAFGQSNSSIITDEYSGDMYLTTKGSFSSTSIGTIRRLSFNTTLAPGMLAGTTYTIESLGTTNFTLYGASSNTIGTSFTATGPGTGTGTAAAQAPFEYKTFGTNLTNKLEITHSQNIPDGSPWSKTIDSWFGHVIGNNIMFHATSTRYGSVYVQAKFSTTVFSSVAQGQTNDTLKLDSPTALVNPQTSAPATITSNFRPGKFGTTVTAGVPTYYWTHPGSLVYNISVNPDGVSRAYTSTGITMPVIPNTVGALTDLADAWITAWNGSTVSPVYWAVVQNSDILATAMVPGRDYVIAIAGSTNFTLVGASSNNVGTTFTATAAGTGSGHVTQTTGGGMHMLKCVSGVWSVVATSIHQTELASARTARNDFYYLFTTSASGHTLLTEAGRMLYHFSVPVTGGTFWYYGYFDTGTNVAVTGSINSWNAISTGPGGYGTQNNYPGNSWGYSTALGYYHFQSTTVYDAAYFLSSRDVRDGSTITETQWFTNTATRKQMWVTTESATGLIAYISSYPLFIGGYYCTTPTQSIALNPSAVNYVYASKHAGDRTSVDITVSTTLLPTSFIRVLLAEITTDATNIVSQVSYPVRQYDTVEELGNVVISTKLANDVLGWNGTEWTSRQIPASATTATASTIVQRDPNADITAQHFLQTSAVSENPTINQVMVTTSADNVMRKASIAHFSSSLPFLNLGNIAYNGFSSSITNTYPGGSTQFGLILKPSTSSANTVAIGFLPSTATAAGPNATMASMVHLSSNGGIDLQGTWKVDGDTIANYGANVWTTEQQFSTLAASTVGSAANAGTLQAYTASGSGLGAIMAFHRAGQYALNMGLDNDNVFRLGGWSDGLNSYRLQSSKTQFTIPKLVASFDGVVASSGQAGDIVSRRSATTGVLYFGDNNNHYLYFDGTNYNLGGTSANGLIVAGDVAAFSDARLKTDVVTIDHALDKVMALRGVDFTRTDGGALSTGVIAQEVQEVLPRVVHETNDGTLSVSYGNMVGVLIEAIKEQQRQIEELRAEIASLRA